MIFRNDLHPRIATPNDSAAIANIYNEGIEDRVATFETQLRQAEDILKWFDGIHPMVVVERKGVIVGFASTSNYRNRTCYAGIAEVSVYVARLARKSGVRRIALQSLLDEVEKAGFWKLISRVFVNNIASRKLISSFGFREVGVYEKHSKLDGIWRDVIIVERLISANIR